MPRVTQKWLDDLPLQQQAVLMVATRGLDGAEKYHGSKGITRSIRACVFTAAYYNRPLVLGECVDTFMDMSSISEPETWRKVRQAWHTVADGLPLHFFQHTTNAAAILRRHPHPVVARAWTEFYVDCVAFMHMLPESIAQMDCRLCDWHREAWGRPIEHGKQRDPLALLRV